MPRLLRPVQREQAQILFEAKTCYVDIANEVRRSELLGGICLGQIKNKDRNSVQSAYNCFVCSAI
jgi:hypothetical protein